jgi:hypothetical protein
MIAVLDSAFKRPDVNHWDEKTVLQFLPFVCYIPPRSGESSEFSDDSTWEDICTLEHGDLKLLKQMTHPFQMFTNKPYLLTLAFFPKPLQSLYRQLFSVNVPSFLPFPHLLIEFLFHANKLESYTLRFCILITILLPVFQEYKMENLLLAFMKKCDGDKQYLKRISKKSFCQPFTKILLKKQSNSISSQSTIEDAIEEECRRISMASNNMIKNSNQLYASSICLARLTQVLDKETKVSITTMIDEALIAAKNIENPLWRLDALLAISGAPDTTRFESSHFISELENALVSSPSFLGSVALIIRCLLNSERKFKPERLFDKIFELLHLQSEDEQEVICEALAYFPFLQLRVYHFINCKTRWTKTDHFHVFNRIFQLHSSTFAATFLVTNPSSFLHKTLSASMYLAELSIDIIKLEERLVEKMHAGNTPQQLAKKCLHALHQSQSFLSTETVSSLSTYFVYYEGSSTSFTNEDHNQLQTLEHALLYKRLEDVESASHFVLKWLNYDHHPFLFHCAHMGAVLLAQSGIRSPEIIQKCCKILISEEYCHCPEQARVITNNWGEFDKNLFEILLGYFIREDYAEYLSINLCKDLNKQLVVRSSQELKLLFDAERQKHQMTIGKQNGSTSQWSLFDLITTWPENAPQYFMNVLSLLKDDTEYSFLI